jgi:hypothetical protein
MQRILILSCIGLVCIASIAGSTFSYAQDDRFRDERRPAPTEIPPPLEKSTLTMDRKVCIANCAETQRTDRLACKDVSDKKKRQECKDKANETSDRCRSECRFANH